MSILLTICNENPPKKTKHICFYVQKKQNFGGEDTLQLLEIVEEFYPHPQAPDDALVPLYNIHLVKELRKSDPEAAVLVLLEANEKSIQYQMRRIE